MNPLDASWSVLKFTGEDAARQRPQTPQQQRRRADVERIAEQVAASNPGKLFPQRQAYGTERMGESGNPTPSQQQPQQQGQQCPTCGK